MRKQICGLLLAGLILVAGGCTGKTKPAPTPGPAPQAPPQSQVLPQQTAPKPVEAPPDPDLMAVADPGRLSLTDLEAGLRRYVNLGEGTVPDKLTRLFDRWQVKAAAGRILFAEADLDGSSPAEVVTAINGEGGLAGTGALFIIYRKDDRWEVDRTSGELRGVTLRSVVDLTGDRVPEILWSTMDVGAHTVHFDVFASTWRPGRIEQLPGQMTMASMQMEIQGSDILLRGGLIGSVGAGEAQRERTDRYRFTGGRFALVDRQYVPSTFGYHRLQDGIVAETVGRREDAVRALMEAAEPSRPAGSPTLTEPQWAGKFPEAVRTLARLRLAVLLIDQGKAEEAQKAIRGATGPYSGLVLSVGSGAGRQAACQAAATYARANPEFLQALNSPMGYANPQWNAENLCGPLPLEVQ